MSSPTAPGYVDHLVIYYNHLVCGWFCTKYSHQQINAQCCSSLHNLGDNLYIAGKVQIPIQSHAGTPEVTGTLDDVRLFTTTL